MSVNITPPSTMASTEHGDDVFEDCVEEPSAASHNPAKDEQPGASPSNPALTDSDGAGGSSNPRTSHNKQIQEKFQAARAEYENKRYVACREKSMELLRQRNLPPITRCLTLRLFASCSYYYGAKHALEQALIIANELGDLDPDQVLRKDVEGLLEDLEQYRPKDGAPRQYIEELEFDDH
ncbi:hypothetical protein DL95DRAFT_456164 [Leptodontidium sp. 2 PMI_412]|nr:hypothetical protein DL95DRAFT_456164 [Leptodontidium sp. 2 PMI_412]